MLPLLFLSQAPPLYLILFLTGIYILQRPCLYCTLLLLLIIVTLFDFQGNWFGDPPPEGANDSTASTNTSSPLVDTLKASASVAGAMLNNTIETAVEIGTQALPKRADVRWSWGRAGWEGLKDIAQRRELKIECINTIIRL